MTKVLLVGNGAREHAIAEKVVEANGILYAVMNRKNPGIAKLAKDYLISDLTAFERLIKFKNVDLAIIGPEIPLAYGITDYLLDNLGIPVVGPRKVCAQIETSKTYCRDLLTKYKIPGNPMYKICTTPKEVQESIISNHEIVIKPDGLTGGKGVKVFGDHLHSSEEVLQYALKCLQKDEKVLLEEKLAGVEFTLQAFTDGRHLAFMPLVRDYKRAYENDKGPNTGSMGSYSQANHSLSFIQPRIIEQAKNIMQQTIQAIHQDTNFFYRGILYGQFMQTKTGVNLIEFNVRFGDPEAMNVLSLMESNILDTAQAITGENLSSAKFRKNATVCVYLVPQGYPENPSKDNPLVVNELEKSSLFYASVYEENDIVYTTGSRALAILAQGKNIPSARESAYGDVTKISGDIRYRKDIASDIQE